MPYNLIKFLTEEDLIDITWNLEVTRLVLFDLLDESTTATHNNNIQLAKRIWSSAACCAIDRLSTLAVDYQKEKEFKMFDPLFTEELKIYTLDRSDLSLMYRIVHNQTTCVVRLRDNIQNAQNERKKIQWLNKVYGLGPKLRRRERRL